MIIEYFNLEDSMKILRMLTNDDLGIKMIAVNIIDGNKKVPNFWISKSTSELSCGSSYGIIRNALHRLVWNTPYKEVGRGILGRMWREYADLAIQVPVINLLASKKEEVDY